MEKKLNLLVVDDEQIVLDSVKKLLRREEDFSISTALNVDEALKIMGELNIQIILTDLMMPDIDGLEFLKIIQEKYPKTLSIMITGYATINTALQATQLGAFDYIAKPFTRDELKKVVRRAADLAKVSENQPDQKQNNNDTKKEKLKGIGENSWIKMAEDGFVTIGVERSFLMGVGRIQTVYLPAENDTLRQGSVYFQIFSSDMSSQSLLSPLSGTVIKVNEDVINNPGEKLQSSESDIWLIKLVPSKYDEEMKIIEK